MNITEFAESRNQQPQTISRYMSRHSEFEGHTTKNGKMVELDEEALKMLDEVYPLPKPIQIINGIPEEEHLKALADKDEKIQKLQEAFIELQNKYSQLAIENGELQGQRLLLEDKKEQLRAKDDELKAERSKSEELTLKLEIELKKSWWDKLRGK